MSRQTTLFQILIASPSDVKAERNKLKDIIYEWNISHSQILEIFLVPVMWESAVHSEVGNTPQNIVNGQIDITNIDMTIGIFGNKVGTATENYLSGTIEELEISINNGNPTMMFFSKKDLIIPKNTSQKEASYILKEWNKLRVFQKSYQNNSIYGEFDSTEDFSNELKRQLDLYFLKHYQKPNPNSNSISNNIPVIEKVYKYNKKDIEDIDVLVVGGANIEYIYKRNEVSYFLEKQSYDEKKIEYGGSGLNYTLRLTATKVNVIPIIPIGNDSEGKDIVKKLEEEREKVELGDINFSYLLNDKLKTIDSLILSDKKGRTIWSKENFKLTYTLFNALIKTQINSNMNPKFLMIGHIHSDTNQNKESLNIKTLSTYQLIEKFNNTNTMIYVNLGRTQLEYGYEFWKDSLSKVDILQLNIDEIKFFLNASKEPPITLSEVIKILSTLNINIIITLDKLGAICITNGGENFYAPEIKIDSKYKDKTGAGDAFASGMVFYLLSSSKNKVFRDMRNAIEIARIWATYACTSLGGASKCPSLKELEEFESELRNEGKIDNIENLTPLIINLIDKAYVPC